MLARATFFVASLLACLGLAAEARGQALPVARASFPLPSSPSAPSVGAFPTPSPATRPAPPAPPVSWELTRLPPLHPPPAPIGPDTAESAPKKRDLDRWMLSVEGVTRAPIDAGVQGVLETPVGLRLFGGYAWVPSTYLDRVTGAAASISSDPTVAALLDQGLSSGRTWRLGLGWRPFHDVGVYLDLGYARAHLQGEVDLTAVGPAAGTGPYELDTTLGAGFVEIGYQAKIAHRVVFALAIGATKVLSAETRVASTSAESEEPVRNAAGLVDQGMVKYGTLPTLTLRLGLDLI